MATKTTRPPVPTERIPKGWISAGVYSERKRIAIYTILRYVKAGKLAGITIPGLGRSIYIEESRANEVLTPKPVNARALID